MSNATRISTPSAPIGNAGTRNTTETESFVVLQDGHAVSAQFFDELKAHIESRIRSIKWDRPITLKVICGKEFWDQLTKWERIAAGRSVVHMVEGKLLPLTFAGRSNENSMRYVMK